MGYQHFGEFAGEGGPLEGKKKKLSEVLDCEILILAYRIARSKFKDKNYVTIQFENDGDKYVVFTGSEVLMEQLGKYSTELPFYATITKRFNYFTLS